MSWAVAMAGAAAAAAVLVMAADAPSKLARALVAHPELCY